MESKITMRRKAVEISGGRNLYSYEFEGDGRELPPMTPDDLQPTVEPKEEESA